jgi:DNA-directed RNA polymerase sigma subunit (sigma70/sigma32)
MNVLTINKELIHARKEFQEYEVCLLEQIKEEIKQMRKTKKYPSRYYKLLMLRFYKRMTFEQVGVIMGVTRERLRQMECRVLEI